MGSFLFCHYNHLPCRGPRKFREGDSQTLSLLATPKRRSLMVGVIEVFPPAFWCPRVPLPASPHILQALYTINSSLVTKKLIYWASSGLAFLHGDSSYSPHSKYYQVNSTKLVGNWGSERKRGLSRLKQQVSVRAHISTPICSFYHLHSFHCWGGRMLHTTRACHGSWRR
jgi:hypothetical protein